MRPVWALGSHDQDASESCSTVSADLDGLVRPTYVPSAPASWRGASGPATPAAHESARASTASAAAQRDRRSFYGGSSVTGSAPWYAQPETRPARAGERVAQPEHQDRWEDDDDEKGEWDSNRLGGDYLQGIGYRNAMTGNANDVVDLSDEIDRARIEARRAFLEKHYGTKQTAYEDSRFPSRGWKERVRRAKEERKTEKRMAKERAGVDSKGRLVFDTGRWRRIGLRTAQGATAVLVGVGSIAAALATSPDEAPPPSGRAAAWAMYLFPFVSFGQTLYFHVIKPFRYRRRAQRASQNAGQGVTFSNQPGVDGGNGGCCGRRKKGGQPAQYPSVNLMLDASFVEALKNDRDGVRSERRGGRSRRTRSRKRGRHLYTSDLEGSGPFDSSGSDSEGESDAWSDTSEPGRHYRKAILSRFAAEQRWREARRGLKVVTSVDVAFALAWVLLALFVVGWGKRCPPGGYQGYCNLYNLGVAFAVICAIVFVACCVYDVVDLRQSSVPPRMRSG